MLMKIILMLVFGACCIFVGNSFNYNDTLNIVQLSVSAIGAFASLLSYTGYDQWRERKLAGKAEDLNFDRNLFKRMHELITEDLFYGLESHCAECVIPCEYVNSLINYHESYFGSELEQFHNKKVHEAYSSFMKSVTEYLNFTSKNLFPTQTGCFTLRQMTANGIEKNVEQFGQIKKEYYEALDSMVADYRTFIKTAHKQRIYIYRSNRPEIFRLLPAGTMRNKTLTMQMPGLSDSNCYVFD